MISVVASRWQSLRAYLAVKGTQKLHPLSILLFTLREENSIILLIVSLVMGMQWFRLLKGLQFTVKPQAIKIHLFCLFVWTLPVGVNTKYSSHVL